MAKDLTLQVGTLAEAILNLVKRIEHLLCHCEAANPRQRILVALAGVPGSGKSTVSHALMTELAARGINDVAIVPMDGFHYTKKVLAAFEDPDLAFRRRGAPFTFDAEAFLKLVQKLKDVPVTANDEPDVPILAPSFDHAIKDPIPDSISISSQTRLVIIEGNYTLLKQSPWDQVASLCAEKWFVDAPPELVKNRLAKRHFAAGIELSMSAAMQRAKDNDIPNGEMIRSLLIKPDVTIEN